MWRSFIVNLLMLAKQEPDIIWFLSRLSEHEKLMTNGFQSNKDGQITLSTVHSNHRLLSLNTITPSKYTSTFAPFYPHLNFNAGI